MDTRLCIQKTRLGLTCSLATGPRTWSACFEVGGGFKTCAAFRVGPGAKLRPQRAGIGKRNPWGKGALRLALRYIP